MKGPDFTDRSVFADGPPLELFARMRAEAPVCWSDAPPDWEIEKGYWNVTRAADITAVHADPETYSSWRRGWILHIEDIAPLEVMRMMMIGRDAPEHTRMRGIVNAAFTPRRVAAVEPAIRALITGLIDEVIEAGECDFVEDIASGYTNGTIAEMLGVPHEDRPMLFHWTDTIMTADDPESRAKGTGMQAMMDAAGYLLTLTAQREQDPRDDLVTALGEAEYEGMTMPQEERAGIFIQLFAAGIDTTRGTLGLGLQALLDHPGQRDLLIADPGLIPGAVEEVLRWTSVGMHERRTATRDTVLGGQPIAEGDAVVLWYGSAGRDPALVGEDPDRFDVRRARCRHQAFGPGGPHFCLGAGLARLELRVAFEEILRRMPDIGAAWTPDRIQSNLVAGYRRMPVRFTPGARSNPA
jgi:cytochrome P450